MLVFLDFEASSLGRNSYPIEVGWVFEDGRGEDHLIRPAPDWTDWDARAEAIHGIPRATLERDGTAHEAVAARMVAALEGHMLCASAPSWDGKWLSVLLRAAGLPRHALRLRDSDDIRRDAILAGFGTRIAPDARIAAAEALADRVKRAAGPPAHRARADAEAERTLWLAMRAAAEADPPG
ncbi:3'-5' exonuclease [Sphingomonas morindae]|uniref:Transcriptional regulator n=1 Tax=Sphingomonas morindae TaxID=1541170 RepID=A0ABY4XDT5_9SPHN|nr:transcriptional regulator [Sphingomonas morindae]USI75018.1 transcriptional regulator [Sphingomonas morindae]